MTSRHHTLGIYLLNSICGQIRIGSDFRTVVNPATSQPDLGEATHRLAWRVASAMAGSRTGIRRSRVIRRWRLHPSSRKLVSLPSQPCPADVLSRILHRTFQRPLGVRLPCEGGPVAQNHHAPLAPSRAWLPHEMSPHHKRLTEGFGAPELKDAKAQLA